MKLSRFTDEQIIGFLKQADAGMSVKELCRSGGFTGAGHYVNDEDVEKPTKNHTILL